jgi:predicted RNase H-like nuclease
MMEKRSCRAGWIVLAAVVASQVDAKWSGSIALLHA